MGITPAQFPASGQRAGGEPERELSLPMDILKESYHSHPLAQMGVEQWALGYFRKRVKI